MSSNIATESMPAEGIQDKSGWGLLGLTLGILVGFFAPYFLAMPMFPKVQDALVIATATTLTVASMTLGGLAGYFLLRKKV